MSVPIPPPPGPRRTPAKRPLAYTRVPFAPKVDPVTRFVFAARLPILILFALATIVLGWSASRTRIDAAFEKQLPLRHEYIQTFLQYQENFGSANLVLFALTVPEGDIYTAPFFARLKEATDGMFFLTGVDRASVTSLLTPNVRFVEIVEDGFAGGNVVPADFQPDERGLEQVRTNTLKSGRVGQIVANDFTGAMVSAQLIDRDPQTGVPLDYFAVGAELEALRERIETAAQADGAPVNVHIIGYAKLVKDVGDGARGVVLFFGISIVVTTLLVWMYAQSFRFAVPPVVCSLVAVVWQLGLLAAFGLGIDPLSILVPFLVFAIGVSHGVQMVRTYRAALFGGAQPLPAAQRAFRQLLVPGGAALLTDTIGFLTMLIIDIGTVRELAMAASLGVGVIILTNLLVLPLILSYLRPPSDYAERVGAMDARLAPFWSRFDRVTYTWPSVAIIATAAALAAFGAWKGQQVAVGDLHEGVPYLHEDSRFNRDAAMITKKFSIGVDLLTVIAEVPENGVVDAEAMRTVDRMAWWLRNVEGVQSVVSLPGVAQTINAGWNEGSLKWRVLPRTRETLALSISPVETSSGLLNQEGTVIPILAFLADHRAETLRRVTDAVKQFRERDGPGPVKFRLASGSAGVAAATNEVVSAAQFPMLIYVFGAVIILCLATFRSFRATLCIVTPLAVVSLLSYALMVYLKIGLKSATLPVVALGVGVGVDYGIYLFARLEGYLKQGEYFEDAMNRTFQLTGSAVVFTGLTLGIGVSTWIFSDLKFQADMGVLLTFMFLVNMLGAMILLPALARWLYRHHRKGEA